MEIGDVTHYPNGLWSLAITPGRAGELIAALDPDLAYVLIETWDGIADWHETLINLGPDDESQPRLVRQHRFDLLVSPSEAATIGRQLSARREGGGLACWQFRTRPSSDFRLPSHSQGRATAMRGLGVQLAIELPHENEVAVVSSPIKTRVGDFGRRLAQPPRAL